MQDYHTVEAKWSQIGKNKNKNCECRKFPKTVCDPQRTSGLTENLFAVARFEENRPPWHMLYKEK